MSASKVVSAETLLVLAIGLDGAVVDAAGEPPQPLALGAVAAHQLGFVGALQVGDGAQAVAREPFLRRRADAPDERRPAAPRETRGLRRCRSPRSRAACRGRRRSWPGTCCRTGRPRR